MEVRKPTLGPIECNHCHKVWYGEFHTGTYIPDGKILCLYCWSELDEWLYRNFKQIYNTSWAYMKPENIPTVHAKAEIWIADSTKKPLRPNNIYRGGGVPKWMQSAIEKGLVVLGSGLVYIVTTDGNEAISAETSQDRTLLKGTWRKKG